MKSFISSSRLLRTRRVSSGKKALERWLAAEPPQQDLIASYRVRAYTDRDGDQEERDHDEEEQQTGEDAAHRQEELLHG